MTRPDPAETAWKIHAAQVQWTSNVDSKASLVLAVESALLAGVVTLSGGGHRLMDMDAGWAQRSLWSGVALLILGVLAVGWAVIPHLRVRKLPREQATNFIYFGHLRYWEPADIEASLRDEDIVPVLARQISQMSKVAWRKHRALQLSMAVTAVGTALIAVAALLNG